MSSSIKKDVYGMGAALADGFGKASAYLARQSERAAQRMAEMERRAAEEAAAQRAANEVREAAEPTQDAGIEGVTAGKPDADISDVVRGLFKKAREEGAEIGEDLREQVRTVLARLDSALGEARKATPTTPEPRTDEPQARVVTPSEITPPGEDPKQIHY